MYKKTYKKIRGHYKYKETSAFTKGTRVVSSNKHARAHTCTRKSPALESETVGMRSSSGQSNSFPLSAPPRTLVQTITHRQERLRTSRNWFKCQLPPEQQDRELDTSKKVRTFCFAHIAQSAAAQGPETFQGCDFSREGKREHRSERLVSPAVQESCQADPFLSHPIQNVEGSHTTGETGYGEELGLLCVWGGH